MQLPVGQVCAEEFDRGPEVSAGTELAGRAAEQPAVMTISLPLAWTSLRQAGGRRMTRARLLGPGRRDRHLVPPEPGAL